MERFSGQLLRGRPHIAVLFYDAIGDFVVATPLLRGLREKYSGCTIDYFGGERSRALEEASELIDDRFSVFGDGNALSTLARFVERRVKSAGPYDLAINCDDHHVLAVVAGMLEPRYVTGRAYRNSLRELLPPGVERVDALSDESWADPDLLLRFGDVIQSQYIGEILCRLARVETDFSRTEVTANEPPFPTPSVLISTGGKRRAKLWPAEHWRSLLHKCQAAGIDVGLLGDKPEGQRAQYHAGEAEDYLLAHTALVDLRGRLSLPEVAGALRRARACVTVDNGIMHIAGAMGTPTLALFGASPWRVWVPPRSSIKVVLGSVRCPMCEDNRFRNEDCLREAHVCMESIDPALVFDRLQSILGSASVDGYRYPAR